MDKNSINRYTFEKSRTGEIVPFLGTQPLHSMVDPTREANRLVSTITEDTGFVIFLGLGGGFAAEAALEQTNAQIAVIDFNADEIAFLLSARDYSRLLNNDRFILITDPDSEKLKKFILENYKPSLHGGIKTIPLRTRVEADAHLFENAVLVIQEAVEICSRDYSVQAHFGMRWFSNIIRNIKYADSRCYSFPPEKIKNAAIAAAGPSLDYQLTSLGEFKARNGFIISTDTALPALLQNKIEPDAVVSIDCQHISYYHFLCCNLIRYAQRGKKIPLILDIASPPGLSRLPSFAPFFFSSGHPLARYITQTWKPLPLLDTSGANVTYACLSLAEYLGADHITLFGADFAYTGSQAYARGTYILPYFENRQKRFTPMEAQVSALLYRSPFLPPENGVKADYRETASLRFYRKKLEEKAVMMTASVTCMTGGGAPVRLGDRDLGDRRQELGDRGQELGDRRQGLGVRGQGLEGDRGLGDKAFEFLEGYRDDIAGLPLLNDRENYFTKLDQKQTLIFTTLLPFAAAVRKRNPELKYNYLIEEVKNSCVAEIEKVLCMP